MDSSIKEKPNTKAITEEKWFIRYILIIMKVYYERQVLDLGLQIEFIPQSRMWKLEFNYWDFILLLLYT